ncbi:MULTISPECIES: (2Fe-2S)-binding protein [Catenuloplanes]|uniref:(2Fe-2S)-binding protein n=1 Tax=Catenuloplanes niger TaxID=587534 RepID=A0AAE4CWX2_9ACTN|nr:(2Fe-2S)-binding protein [Catenuloplanes niger]MDR7326008.1 hypothetical protein [Catenuloplanes niger]
MTGPYRVAPAHDPVAPADGGAIELTVDGEPVAGRAGQTIAGVLLASGRVSWRTSPRGGRPRGVFCGIGVCFDCLVVVNGLRDVRACQRRAADGDVITRQDDAGPPDTVRAGRGRADGDVNTRQDDAGPPDTVRAGRGRADGDVNTRQDDAGPRGTHPSAPQDGGDPGHPAAARPGDGDRPPGRPAASRPGGDAVVPRHHRDQPGAEGGR